jgi:hypothetical protein
MTRLAIAHSTIAKLSSRQTECAAGVFDVVDVV